MRHLYLLFIFVALISCTESKDTSNTGQNIIPAHQPDPFADFEKVCNNLEHYSKDTLKTIAFPGEGGEVIAYRAKADNLLLQVFLYGEMGKTHYLYLLDKKLNHQLTKIVQYRYDRPFTEAAMQIDSTVNYIRYLPGVSYFDNDKMVLKDTATVSELRTVSEALFKDIISQADLRK